MMTAHTITMFDQDIMMTSQDITMFHQDIMLTWHNKMRHTQRNNKVAPYNDVCL